MQRDSKRHRETGREREREREIQREGCTERQKEAEGGMHRKTERDRDRYFMTLTVTIRWTYWNMSSLIEAVNAVQSGSPADIYNMVCLGYRSSGCVH